MSLLGLTAEIVKERQDTTFIMLVFKKSAGEYFCEKIYHFHNSLCWGEKRKAEEGRMRKYKLETDSRSRLNLFNYWGNAFISESEICNLRRTWESVDLYLYIEYLIQLAIVGIDVAPKYLIKSAVYFITIMKWEIKLGARSARNSIWVTTVRDDSP